MPIPDLGQSCLPVGLGGDGTGQDRAGEIEFGQSFHGVDFSVEDRSAVSAAFAFEDHRGFYF